MNPESKEQPTVRAKQPTKELTKKLFERVCLRSKEGKHQTVEFDCQEFKMRVQMLYNQTPVLAHRTIFGFDYANPIGTVTLYSIYAKCLSGLKPQDKVVGRKFPLINSYYYSFFGINGAKYGLSEIENGTFTKGNKILPTKRKKECRNLSQECVEGVKKTKRQKMSVKLLNSQKDDQEPQPPEEESQDQEPQPPEEESQDQESQPLKEESRDQEPQPLKEESRDQQTQTTKSKCKKLSQEGDYLLMNLSTTRKGKYVVCGINQISTCFCYHRIHGFFEESLSDLEIYKKFYPGRTYYIYGFGTFPSKPILSSANAMYDRLCILINIDGHFHWVENTFIHNIYLFKSTEIAKNLKVQKSDDYREYISKLCSPILPLCLIDKYFVPHPRPTLNNAFLTWLEKKNAKLSEELPTNIQNAIRFHPRNISTEAEKGIVFNKRQINKFAVCEPPSPFVPPFIIGEPISVLPPKDPPPVIQRCFNLPRVRHSTKVSVEEKTTDDEPLFRSYALKEPSAKEDLVPTKELPDKGLTVEVRNKEISNCFQQNASSSRILKETSDLPSTTKESTHAINPTPSKCTNSEVQESNARKALPDTVNSKKLYKLCDVDLHTDENVVICLIRKMQSLKRYNKGIEWFSQVLERYRESILSETPSTITESYEKALKELFRAYTISQSYLSL